MSKLVKATNGEMKRFSIVIYKSNECTLTIYKTKPSKKFTILSLKHRCVKIKNNKKQILKTVMYYNKTNLMNGTYTHNICHMTFNFN